MAKDTETMFNEMRKGSQKGLYEIFKEWWKPLKPWQKGAVVGFVLGVLPLVFNFLSNLMVSETLMAFAFLSTVLNFPVIILFEADIVRPILNSIGDVTGDIGFEILYVVVSILLWSFLFTLPRSFNKLHSILIKKTKSLLVSTKK